MIAVEEALRLIQEEQNVISENLLYKDINSRLFEAGVSYHMIVEKNLERNKIIP